MSQRLQIEIAVDPQWVGPMTERLAELGLGYEPVFGTVNMAGPALLSALRSLDTIELEALPVVWDLRAATPDPGREDMRLATLSVWHTTVTNVRGAFVFDFGTGRFGAAVVGTGRGTDTVLAAPSLRALTELSRTVARAAEALDRNALQIYGAESYGLARRRLRAVDDGDIVLPPSLKSQLLAYVDAFARTLAASDPRDHEGDGRGILLLGRPGTGKTLMAQHILHRLADTRKYLFVQATAGSGPFDARGFEQMVVSLESGNGPAVVLVEDVDRMFKHAATTPQYFLNVLDGVLRPSVPVLWIATSNDPEDMADNLLDRPGRFDRVFLFPEPDREAREALLRLYASVLPDPDALEALVDESAGLTGAHIREVCRSADIRRETDELTYTEALHTELERMLEQHRGSRSYARSLRGSQPVGFQHDGAVPVSL